MLKPELKLALPGSACRTTILLITVTLLVGCDSPPAVQLDFPPPNAQFTGNALTIRGQLEASNPEATEITVSSASGSLDALIDTGNDSWSVADYELFAGRQHLEIIASSPGSLAGPTISLDIDTSPNTLRMTGVAEVVDEVFVCDARLQAIIRVDKVVGTRTVVSGMGRGTGPPMQVPTYLQANDTELLVLDQGAGSILRVNTVTGDRVEITGPGRGDGISLQQPRVFTVFDRQILVADPGLDAIVSIDLDTGNRRLLFREYVEDNPVILAPRGIVVDSSGVIHVADEQYRAVIGIDMAIPGFGITTGGDVGEGEPLQLPRDLQITPDNRLLLLDLGPKAIVEIDRGSGERIRVGEGFDIPVALGVGSTDWLVADNGEGIVWMLSKAEPRPVAVTRVGVGEGPSLGSPSDLVTVNGGWFITDSASGNLVHVDTASGRRRLEMSGFGRPVSIADDPDSDSLYILNAEFNRASVSIYEKGTVRVVSSPTLGTGPHLIDPRDMLVESGRILVLESIGARIVSLDPDTGERTIFADSGIGLGESLAGVTRFTLDEVRDVLYLLDFVGGRVLQLDLESGLRSELLVADPDTVWQDIAYDRQGDRLLILNRSETLLQSWDLTGQLLTPVVGRGELPDTPFALSVMPRSLVAVVDSGLDALFVVDLERGDRVLVSR